MLLNELQDQQRKIAAMANSSAEQGATITSQAEEIRELKRLQTEMEATLLALQTSITISHSASVGEVGDHTLARMRCAAPLQASTR
jgi:hypothetical protein